MPMILFQRLRWISLVSSTSSSRPVWTAKQQQWLLASATLAAMAGMVSILYAIVSTIILTSFAQVEQQTTRQTVDAALREVEQASGALMTIAQDYQSRSDVQAALQSRTPETASLNAAFERQWFTNHQVNVFLVANSKAELRFGQTFNLDLEPEQESPELKPIPISLRTQLQANSPLLQPPPGALQRQGLLLLPECPLLVASSLIVDPVDRSVPLGSVIVGRCLNSPETDRLSQLTDSTVSVYPLEDPNLTPELRQARTLLLTTGNRSFVQSLNNTRIAGYTLLRDVSNRPALILRIETDRSIYQQGRNSLRYVAWALLVVSGLLGYALWRLLHRLIRYISERDQMEQALYQEKELAQTTLQAIGDGVITTDTQGRIKSLNAAAERLTGWQTELAQGLPLARVVHLVTEDTGELLETLVEQALQGGRFSEDVRRSILIGQSGDELAIDASVAPIPSHSGQAIGAVLVFRDVTQARNQAQQLSLQANYDPLTGLMNRREFERSLERAISTARTQQQQHCLCFIDLDHFKQVNDSCGHIAGDELLRQISVLLQNQVRRTDIVARLGGDEFAVLFYQCPIERAMRIARSICQAVEDYRFLWQGRVFSIGASLGLVPIVSHSPSLIELVEAADAACYVAKNRGRGQVHVYQVGDEEAVRQLSGEEWMLRINQAILASRFQLYYQKILPVRSNTATVEWCEVLVRMVEDSTLVAPDTFIPVAERYSLMANIDRWVIQALFANHHQHASTWLQNSLQEGNFIYSINLSEMSINDEHFISFLREQFAQHAIHPSNICFEVAESVVITNLSKVTAFVQQIKELGCLFAIDDFGSSAFSFTHLQNLAIDYVKIGKAFVRDLVNDPVALATVEAINRIGHVLGVQTIAVFVENESIWEEIAAIGVDYAQGDRVAVPSRLL